MRSSTPGAYGREDERVLALLPESRDAGAIPRVLETVGVTCVMCATPEEMRAAMDKGAGDLLIEEQVLSPRTRELLVGNLDGQPPWSELPIVVLLRQGPESGTVREALQLPGDVTLVERPVRVNTLVAIIQSALRSRRRQYLVRDYLRALDLSETRYRTLFDSIDEGFCVIEMIFDPRGKPVDFRFLETNPSFGAQTGLFNVHGRTMRELAPSHEQYWFETYGRVSLTGEPVRFESWAEQLQRWFDVYAFRIGPAGSRQVAVLFTDVTGRKRAESELREAKDELEIRVQERTEALTLALENLRVETEERLLAVEELRRKDRLLMQQGRMAAMGEMIGFIAHQWRQPLNSLGLIVQELSFRFTRGMLDQEAVETSTASAMRLIGQMSQTIEDFRNFFKPDKQQVAFRVQDVLASTIKLIEASLRDARVTMTVSVAEDLTVEGFPNEYSQVLLNILMNARDVFLERQVAQPTLTIRAFTEGDRAVTTIADNAGGVPEEIIGRIFDPYFTTKGAEQGTGIGLYLAKTIIEKNMEGRLSVRNIDGGAEFRIEV